MGQPSVLVSCVGSVGFDVQGLLLGNAIANEAAAYAAAKAGTSRYVYCSVASEVAACENGWLPAYFQVRARTKGPVHAYDALHSTRSAGIHVGDNIFIEQE